MAGRVQVDTDPVLGQGVTRTNVPHPP
jgi:hypothetical protein